MDQREHPSPIRLTDFPTLLPEKGYNPIAFRVHIVVSLHNNTEKKERAKTALLESNFENRLSFVEESRYFLYNQTFRLNYNLHRKTFESPTHILRHT